MEKLFSQSMLNDLENQNEVQLFLDLFKKRALVSIGENNFSFYFVHSHWNIIERSENKSEWRFLIKSKNESTQTKTFYIFDISFKEKFTQNWNITESSNLWDNINTEYLVETIKINKVYRSNSQKNGEFEEITEKFNQTITQTWQKEEFKNFFHHLLKQINLWLMGSIKVVSKKNK